MGVIVMDEVIQIIRELRFPIACVVALFWQNNHLQEQHREDLNKVTEAINNNTQATNALKDRIGGMQK